MVAKSDPSQTWEQYSVCLWFNVHFPLFSNFTLLLLLQLLLHPFNGLFSRTISVSRHQKVRHSGFFWSKRWWDGSGISWTICKSFAPRSRQITTPVSHHSAFYRPDALPAAQQTASKHWSITLLMFNIGSRPSDHYFCSLCWFVCLFVCAEFFSAVCDPIPIKLGHMLYVWV